jgi:transcriptional repressor NrdR
MKCPKCSNIEDKVIDSRMVRGDSAIRRRRECMQCGYRFTTYEEIVRLGLKVLKRDGSKEEFIRSKLRKGLERACENRPISSDDLEGFLDAVIDDLDAKFDKEVPSDLIGQSVMNILKDVDEVAYVRFASVYKRFADVSEFRKEIEKLLEPGKGTI